ncbi:MAG: YkgJ family cysteine cluster protein, partial [Planctomycetota bacterium]
MMQLLLNPDHRFTCLACGRCCRTTSISLTPAEAQRLATLQPPEGSLPTIQPYVGREGLACRILPRRDGSCPYLRGDNLCAIHAEEGEEKKPLACRLFPLSFLRTPRGLAVPLRFSCPAVACGEGESLKGREGDLGTLVEALGEAAGIRSVGESVAFDATRTVPFSDVKKILDHLLALLDAKGPPLLARAAAAAEFLELVAVSSVEADSRHRYWEGIRDGLLARMSSSPPAARLLPGGLDRIFFRQTAFGLAGVFSPGWLRKSLPKNLSRRIRRLFGGIVYTLGGGSLGHASFPSAVDSVVEASPGEDREPLEPLHRFFRHQLATFA